MATVRVWSEREPGSWQECTESAYLMALLFGGFTRFPLGAYTDAERDALDAAGGPDPAVGSTFSIIDRGALKRYGIRLRQISDGSRAGLQAKLATPGRAMAMAGTYAGLPAGHSLRRWQPTFKDGHAVCAVPLGGGKVLWLDPLAPDNHPGDATDVATALAFAWYPNDAREALAGEFAQEDDMIDPTKHTAPAVCDVAPGGTVYPDPDRAGPALLTNWRGQAGIALHALPATPTEPSGKAALALIVVNMASAGQPRDPRPVWIGVDKISNIRLVGSAASTAETRIGAASTHFADATAAMKTAEGALTAGVTALKG